MNKDKTFATIKQLETLYPHSEFQLESGVYPRDRQNRNPYKVLILFLLSTGTQDKILAKVCHNFFDKFPKAEGIVNAADRKILDIISPVGRQSQKLAYIKDASLYLCDNGNRICESPRHLLRIKGVGNKIYECILAYGCGKPALPVDGNVLRVLYRLSGKNLVEANNLDYDLVRQKLKRMLEPSKWIDTHELLRLHGIAVCRKGQSQCHLCPLAPCQYRKAPFDRKTGILEAQQEAKRVLNDEWEPWRQLICGS